MSGFREAILSRCREIAERLLTERGFVVEHVDALEDGTCVVDFRERDVNPYEYVDCDTYCNELASEYEEERGWGDYEEEDEYERCLNECEENVLSALTHSVRFKPDTMEVLEATIAVPCEWLGIGLEREEERKRRFARRFAEAGCFVNPDAYEFIHPHELAGYYEVEEEPTICYVHPRSTPYSVCRFDKLVRLL